MTVFISVASLCLKQISSTALVVTRIDNRKRLSNLSCPITTSMQPSTGEELVLGFNLDCAALPKKKTAPFVFGRALR